MRLLALQPLVDQLLLLRSAGVDLLFPPSCVACRRPGYHLCPACAQAVEPMGEEICERCGRRQSQRMALCPLCQQKSRRPLRFVRAAALHGGPLREGIHALKYNNHSDLAPVLARYLVAAFRQPPWSQIRLSIDGVVPVPLHAERQRERGYNQAELLARVFCQRLALPLRSHWLHRQRLTRSQVGLGTHERQDNVTDAFLASPEVQGKMLLLIDDVYTTGATLTACASAALAAGALSVDALALAAPDRLGAELPVDA
jgi:ComF family protein